MGLLELFLANFENMRFQTKIAITHFVKNHFIKIYKDDKKEVVDYFVESTCGIATFGHKSYGAPEVLGDKRTD
jgi:hypothetical protein